LASKREHLDGYVTLLEVVEQEDNQFVSSCSQLGVASCGDTIDEALDNLDEAITLYLNDLVETGHLEEVFSHTTCLHLLPNGSKGSAFTPPAPRTPRVPE
jgi:predicted RNase H-like HicB family nuclease